LKTYLIYLFSSLEITRNTDKNPYEVLILVPHRSAEEIKGIFLEPTGAHWSPLEPTGAHWSPVAWKHVNLVTQSPAEYSSRHRAHSPCESWAKTAKTAKTQISKIQISPCGNEALSIASTCINIS